MAGPRGALALKVSELLLRQWRGHVVPSRSKSRRRQRCNRAARRALLLRRQARLVPTVPCMSIIINMSIIMNTAQTVIDGDEQHGCIAVGAEAGLRLPLAVILLTRSCMRSSAGWLVGWVGWVGWLGYKTATELWRQAARLRVCEGWSWQSLSLEHLVVCFCCLLEKKKVRRPPFIGCYCCSARRHS